ncbi:inositol monophosphatase family protein [Motilibacter deserti]|uniref:Histidinol phosphatase n=1 Tax=Motilibacter deserti TaxID=2714956 RepID=A0ABX0GR56_9ACTN|nr:inositol monophosphatase family protein [Motilibacter deserti]NHC13339.1 histidinol phosphatase [Motilibacter deserti]
MGLRLADAADLTTLARFRAQDLRVESKPDATPVTDADRAVEEQVRATLAAERPDDAVHGEELPDTGQGPRRWVVDPIDGTKNFVRGVPAWATLIALLDGDEVVVSVVSAPALGRRWWAARGAGAWGQEGRSEPRRLAASGVSRLVDASVSYSSLDAWGARRPAFLGLLDTAWRTRAFGDFWSYCLVAEGAVDVAAEPEVALHDLAALDLLVREAGGRFTDLGGVPGPAGGSALATNGLLHDDVLAALRPAAG